MLSGLRGKERYRISAEKLWEFTRNTTHLDLHREPGPQLASMIQPSLQSKRSPFSTPICIRFTRLENGFPTWRMWFRTSISLRVQLEDPETGLTRRVLRIGNLPIGALLLRGEISPLTSNAIASLVAITFDRYHSHANVSRTENARQAEQLRTTVLDSLAHAYKTPLTAIRAASTGLSEMGLPDPGSVLNWSLLSTSKQER